MTTDRLPRIVALLLRVPHEYRQYHLGPAEIRRLHGLDADVLRCLTELGLPHVGDGADALFAESDVASVAMHLGLPTVRRLVMRPWLKSLHRLQRQPTVYSVDIRVDCPAPRHGGHCTYRMIGADGTRRDVDTAQRRDRLATVRVEAAEPPYPVPAPLLGLLGDFADVDFYVLPYPLRHSERFLIEERAGSCELFVRVLVQEARRRGFVARPAYGIVAAVPFSQVHCWTEILVDGCWVKVDPQMPQAMWSLGLCTEDDWPQTLSPAGMYHRLAADGPLVSHTGLDCRVSLPTAVAQ